MTRNIKTFGCITRAHISDDERKNMDVKFMLFLWWDTLMS
jgi:hypothetical protein